MNFNLEIRKKQLQSLKQYVKSSEDNVNEVFQSLGWTVPKTWEKEDSTKMVCPINKNHLISRKTSDSHLKLCTLKSDGYKGDELFLSEPSDKNDCCIQLPNNKKIEIIGAVKANKSEFKTAWNGRGSDPLTSDRLTSTFSVDERLALYDYSVKHTAAPPKPEEFTLDISTSKDKKEFSEKDILALERDSKRRRTKYKSVHTSKKSQTEIMREFIDNQMTLYTDWIKQKQEQERREKEKLRRLAKEKIKKKASEEQTDHVYDNSSQYHYISTTYDQNMGNQSNNVQWDKSVPYSYGTEYYNSGQANQGVITDWSHLYQGGIETDDFYNNSGNYQPEEREYIDQTIVLANLANATYTSNDLSSINSDSVYENQVINAGKNDSLKTRGKLIETTTAHYQYDEDKHKKHRTKRE